MNKLQCSEGNIRIITKNDAHYFFGYYDIDPFSRNGKYHLCHKVSFNDRLPRETDVCEVGFVELATENFIKIGETTAWNFQQGAMLRWNPQNENEIIYNIRHGSEFACVIKNIETGKERVISKPLANISSDGTKGLSINFSRLFDFRPGYGYCGLPDPFKHIKRPSNDGVFLVDLINNTAKQIIDYERIHKEFSSPLFPNPKLVINHINFNPGNSRFIMLVRNFRDTEARYQTMVITSDLNGDMFLLKDYCYFSHYIWKNDQQLLAYTEYDNIRSLYLIDDMSDKYMGYDKNIFPDDIHCSYSPNKRYILGDGYPYKDKDGFRNLYLYDTKTGLHKTLLKSFSPPVSEVDIRCDLHARWHPGGDRISFDSMHDNIRCVCLFDF